MSRERWVNTEDLPDPTYDMTVEEFLAAQDKQYDPDRKVSPVIDAWNKRVTATNIIRTAGRPPK